MVACPQTEAQGYHDTSEALTHFVGQDLLQGFSAQATSLQLFSGLLCGLSLHHSFCLSQEVGQQDLQTIHTKLEKSVCQTIRFTAVFTPLNYKYIIVVSAALREPYRQFWCTLSLFLFLW